MPNKESSSAPLWFKVFITVVVAAILILAIATIVIVRVNKHEARRAAETNAVYSDASRLQGVLENYSRRHDGKYIVILPQPATMEQLIQSLSSDLHGYPFSFPNIARIDYEVDSTGSYKATVYGANEDSTAIYVWPGLISLKSNFETSKPPR